MPLSAHAVERPQDPTHWWIKLHGHRRVHGPVSTAGGGTETLVGMDGGGGFPDAVVQQLVGPFRVAVSDVAG